MALNKKAPTITVGVFSIWLHDLASTAQLNVLSRAAAG